MKWYHSIKIKLLGFFLLMCLVSLFALILTFSFLKENKFKENAQKESSLAKQEILSYIQKKQTKAEIIVLSMVGIQQDILENIQANRTLIPTMLEVHLSGDSSIQSAGIWFQPYFIDKNIKDYMLFFNRNKKNSFDFIEDYGSSNKINFREMSFYKLGKSSVKGDIAWTNVYSDPLTHIAMITVVSPIYKNNLFVGVVSLDISVEDSDKEVWSKINGEYTYLMMIDQNGTFIGKSTLARKHTKEIENIYDIKEPKLKKLIQKINPTLEKHKVNAQSKNEIKKDLYIIDYDPILNEKSIVSIYHLPLTHWHIIIGIKEAKIMAEHNETFQNIIVIIIVLTLISSLIGYLVLERVFVNPIESIISQLRHNLKNNKIQYALLSTNDKGEIGTLIDNLNARTTSLQASRLGESLEIEKNKKNKKLLLQQSKMAAMGEMMDAVAHQWKQPLNALSMYSEIIKSDYDDGSVDKAYITQFRDDIQTQIDHMVNTLDEFRSFFRPNKEHEVFLLSTVVNSVLFLTKDDLLKNRITVNIEQNDPISIDGSQNEFKHLILNIINNAKDAFNQNDIERRIITIRMIQNEKVKRLEIEDNAGGIPEEIIADIFKAHVTSKAAGKGTGIGLYMSTQIATKHEAILSVKNQNDGACFSVIFNF